MPRALKRNAIVTFSLALFFWWAFMFAKHDPALRPVIPFGDDPYDAVGSFGVIVAMLVALIALGRAFRPYRTAPDAAQKVFLLRSEVAVVLAVYITLLADIVALVRHPSMWMSCPSRNEVLLLLGGLAAAATAALLLVRQSRETSRSRWTPAVVTVIAFVLLLAVYPEGLIHEAIPHLLTVVVGAVALFAPMRAIVVAFVPYEAVTPVRSRWGAVLFVGALVGAFAFIGEMSEGGGHPPLGKLMLVGAVFVALAIAGLLVAYAFLGAPLGLARRPSSLPW